jgi:hypothetical protein
MAWGKPGKLAVPERTGAVEKFLAFAPMVVLLVLGLWIPGPLLHILRQAALVLQK